ncbi:MAG: hypothetical protein ACRDBQ_18675 [Shewanella sp.]
MLNADGKNKVRFGAPKAPIDSLVKPLDGIKETSNIVTEPSRTTVIDLERVPLTHLLQYVQGSKWNIRAYYRRLSGKNDPLQQFDPAIDTAIQSFDKIVNMEFRVTSPLSRAQDTRTKTFSLTGSSTLATTVPANEYDVFEVDLGDNRIGLFTVKESERLSDKKISTYAISYTMLYEVTPEIRRVLDACTVRTYHYVPDRMWYGADPLLTPKEYASFVSIGDHIDAIDRTYLKRFYNTDARTIVHPDTESGYCYDVFLARFINNLGLRLPGRDLHIYPHPPRELSDIVTVWDCIKEQDSLYLEETNMVNRTYGSRTFRTAQSSNTVAWSKIKYTRYFTKYVREQAETVGAWPQPIAFEPTMVKLDRLDVELPEFLPVALEDTYVFSESFYGGGFESVLEYVLQEYLNRRAVSVDTVIELSTSVRKLPPQEQLYFTPIVYVLLRYVR